MSIQTRTVEYTHRGETLEALMAWDDNFAEPRPGVLVSHAARGREAFECDKAVALAELGYVGFALDVYGKGVQVTDRDAASALMNRFIEDRELLQSRMHTGVEVARSQPQLDAARVAAIGFCFGGLCVLDLARTGADVLGVCSFHGLLSAPGNTDGNSIDCRVLVEHGWDDPMVPPQQVVAFATEMTGAGADWQLHAHGDTVHSFTNPGADERAAGTAYQADADRRSWQSMRNFLEEVLA